MGVLKVFEFTPDNLGNGPALFQWHGNNKYLAIVGVNDKVFILGHEGKIEYSFPLPGTIDMQWDSESDTLAIINEKNSLVHLYSHTTHELNSFDAGVRDLSMLQWSRTGSILAIGTEKGAFVLYNKLTARKIPVVGTHSACIKDADWTVADNKLVMIGADSMLSVSDADGNVVFTTRLHREGEKLILLQPLKAPFTSSSSTTTSCTAVVNERNRLECINLQTSGLTSCKLNSELGMATSLAACSETLCFVGFATGTIGLAALHGVELVIVTHIAAFREPVRRLAYSDNSGHVVAISGNVIHFFTKMGESIREISENAITVPFESGNPGRTLWSGDGQMISVSTDSGVLMTYAMKVLDVAAAYGSFIFYFVAARTVGVKNIRENKVLFTIPIDLDPTFMAAGMGVLAVGNGNRVLYYEYHLPNVTAAGNSGDGAKPASAVTTTTSMNATDGRSIARDNVNTNNLGNNTSGNALHDKSEPHSTLIRTIDYPSVITAIKVCSHFAAVLYEGRVQIHPLHENKGPTMNFPVSPADGKVIAIEMSESLMMFVTVRKICVVALYKMQVVSEFTSRSPIRRAFPNATCTRVGVMDEGNTLFIFNPVTEIASQAEGYETEHKSLLWDSADPNVFVTYGNSNFVTYICSPFSRLGSTCESILTQESTSSNLFTPLPSDYKPLCLFRGGVICQRTGGLLDNIPLRSHNEITCRTSSREAFFSNFSLNRLRWATQNLSTSSEAEDLAVKSLHMLDVELAIRVYRQLGHPMLVMCLDKIKHIQEKNLLIGHVSLIMGYFKDAQTYFLRSSQPRRALEMRRDLMQWEQALSLAKEMAPDEIPVISAEYATQLEYRGDYSKALEMYENGQRAAPTGHSGAELIAATDEVQAHNERCLEGVARCHFRIGNIDQGMRIALQSSNNAFLIECAKLCEELRRYEEAGRLYESVGDVERAASLYIEKAKNLKAAGRLLPQIKSRNILVMFAKSKENEGQFAEAEQAYTQAEDWDSVVRLKVEKLNDLHGAFVIVRRVRSSEAASLVAKVCQQRREFGMAVEFLVVAQCISEAFELAKEHEKMINFENALLAQVPLKDGIAPPSSQPHFAMIANYYDLQHKPAQAALFYQLASNFSLALRKYLESGESEDIDKAVEMVGKAHSDSLTNKLIDYLMGEGGSGEPKDPSYIFKLYMALGSFEKAAKTSVIIATKEQEIGNYKSAHHTLVEACRILQEKKLRISSDLRRTLMLLHSYIIVKDLIKYMHDEQTACRMLLRVVRNIQKFQLHMSTIITSTVLQCVKAEFKKSAFEYARLLIQNEKLRTELNEKNRKKIESVVRRYVKDEDVDPVEISTPCPFCDAPVPETELDCGACKNAIPFCIVTGKHIIKTDYTISPCCKFPAIYSAFIARVKNMPTCPLCEAPLDANKILKVKDPDLKDLMEAKNASI